MGMRHGGEREGSQSASTIATAVNAMDHQNATSNPLRRRQGPLKACWAMALEYHREHGCIERAADLLSRPGDDSGVRYGACLTAP